MAQSTVAKLTTKACGRGVSSALAIILALALLPTAASAAAPKKTCAQLKGKHLKSGGRAVVVTRVINREAERSGIERVAYVCTSARSRAWPAGSILSEEGEPPGISVIAGAGNWVVLRYQSTFGLGFSERDSAVNAANGKRFAFWQLSGGPTNVDGDLLEATKLDSQGRLALILGTEGKPQHEGEHGPTVTRKVVGVTPNGERTVLDAAPTASIPTSSLQLVGGIVHWTDGGTERSAAP
ncbi:MAG TPA: hypothetical protein VMB05_14505 [Solirubrobacteraceae bacterium]|nr:hypothetical protein [Solirubrobacteraceae bacterium]